MGRLPWLLLPWLALPLLAYAAAIKHVDHAHWSGDYDQYFRKYAKHYFGPQLDWRWFKAQGIAESGLNPEAKSPAGAKGIMQILPSTYAEIREKNPHFTSIDSPRWNIAAGIFYDRELYRRWKNGLPSRERLSLALASYNAGYGTIRKAHAAAQKQAKQVRRWAQVAGHAPRETRRYVRRIRDLMQHAD